jgi:hypothetical protein
MLRRLLGLAATLALPALLVAQTPDTPPTAKANSAKAGAVASKAKHRRGAVARPEDTDRDRDDRAKAEDKDRDRDDRPKGEDKARDRDDRTKTRNPNAATPAKPATPAVPAHGEGPAVRAKPATPAVPAHKGSTGSHKP